MPSDLNEILRAWESLCSEAGQSSQTARYRIGGTPKFGVYLAISFEDRSPVLEFGPITRDLLKDNPLPSIKGVESGLSFRSSELYLTLSLRQAESVDVFLTLAAKLTDELSDVDYPVTGYNVIKKTLVVWQAFFRSGKVVLSGPEQIGLAGELMLFLMLLDKGIAQAVVVRAWKGSERSHHDYHLPFGTIETKATVGQDINTISISNMSQLDNTGTNGLFLAQMIMDSHDHGNQTLPLLVRDLRQRLTLHPTEKLVFEEKLLLAGYRDKDESHYTKQSFTVKRVRVFPVNEHFPKLTFGGVPEGVLEASYTINLGHVAGDALSFDDFILNVTSN